MIDGGRIVQPFNDLSAKQTVPPASARDYQVEFWPIGNRFERGHRIRLTLAGTPASFLPSVPAVNSIVAGGRDGASSSCRSSPAPTCAGRWARAPCPTRAPARCLARRSPIGPRNIGRIRLGLTRRQLSRIRVKPVRRTRRSYVYCVKGSAAG